MVLSFDDTGALGLPRFTNRQPKGLTHNRVKVVPFNITNHSTGENTYIYMVKERYKKGGNRLCSILWHQIGKVKNSAHENRHARTLYLMADNYAENKNNTLFAFCSDLVERGWFDEVQLLFGPVGHTHNGNDGVHYVHNRLAGNYVSGTLAHYVNHFHHAWATDVTLPDAAIGRVHKDIHRPQVSSTIHSWHGIIPR